MPDRPSYLAEWEGQRIVAEHRRQPANHRPREVIEDHWRGLLPAEQVRQAEESLATGTPERSGGEGKRRSVRSSCLARPLTDYAAVVEQLEPMLQRLRLTGMCSQLDNLLEEAARHQMTLREGLAWLCAAEVSRKDQSRFEMAMRLARFPCVRTLEGFEFEAQPSIDPGMIRELATCRWIANGDNVVLLGPPGVGKTHLEMALGREAIRLGHSVLFCTAAELIANLTRGKQQGELARALSTYGKPVLLIIDELGYLPLEHQAAYLLFQLISRRYEQGSVLISSNRAVTEWGEGFGDQVLTIRGDSYRLRKKRRSGLIRPVAGSPLAVSGDVPPPPTAKEA